MVIAELPLWVTHRDTSSATTASKSRGKSGSSWNTSNIPKNPPSDDGDDHNNKTATAAALSSLALLQEDRTKCAIYSVDVHPSKTQFATAGGDGTVRIWSSQALFSPQYRGGRFDEQAGYISTTDDDDEEQGNEGGSGSKNAANENQSSGSSTNDDDHNNSSVGTTTEDDSFAKRKKRRKQQHAPERADSDNNKGVVSNSENDDEEEDDRNSESAARRKEKNKNDAMDVDDSKPSLAINDLNQFVRRKKSNDPIQRPASTAKLPPAADRDSSDPPKKQPSHPSRKNQQRLLCTLSAHTGSSVLCVRWSPRGNYLASAGDDGCVCVYAPATQVAGGGGATGNLVNVGGAESTGSVEQQWARILLCRGHNLDAVGLAWAPDDSHLVSCSLDRDTPIIIWNLTDLARGEIPAAHQRIRQPYKILGVNVHTSTVKGVTFDPAGSYLASSGDDPSICIWRAHDDWGLEQRLDATCGIFRQWKEGNDSIISLSSQSLFRRISWATDGSYICSTNSVVKHKNVASTIARAGWTVAADPRNQSSRTSTAVTSGAATLVGHKHPIVVSRHATQWLDVSSKKSKSNKDADDDAIDKDQDEEDEDEEPEYATLLALGDKSGFVTVWSTKKSKPVFKLQCSESRCTVTDLAWGQLEPSGHMMLLISLLDGQVIAVRFHVPDELGPLLSKERQAKVFQLRYGIDLFQVGGDANGSGSWQGQSGMTVGERSGPQLIENALQMSLEHRAMKEDQNEKGEENNDNNDDDGDEPMPLVQDNGHDEPQRMSWNNAGVSMKGGKKRVQPVLVSGNGGGISSTALTKQPRRSGTSSSRRLLKPATDALQDALMAANRAEALTAGRSAKHSTASPTRSPKPQQPANGAPPNDIRPQPQFNTAHLHQNNRPALSPNTERIHSIDLPAWNSPDTASGLTAECTNCRGTPAGARTGPTLTYIDLAITRDGQVVWRDEMPGTSCTATSATFQFWAVGTMDGTIQLYGTSPSMGWECGQAFRIMAPLILGHPIVELQLQQQEQTISSNHGETSSSSSSKTSLFAVIGDGSFFVFDMEPVPCLQYKGSIMPAIHHITLTLPVAENNEYPAPRLSKGQITKQGHLMILLSLQPPPRPRTSTTPTTGSRGFSLNDNNRMRNNLSHSHLDHGVGGSIQGFIYNRALELWTRISDSRFICSDYYQMLPSSMSSPPNRRNLGPLSELDDSVRMGTFASSLKPLGRPSTESPLIQFSRPVANPPDGENSNSKKIQPTFIPTRSHCEDRIACALQLGSGEEVRHWLLKYVKVLILGGHEATLRVVVDMILDSKTSNSFVAAGNGSTKSFFISSAIKAIGKDPSAFVRDEILREMGKNRNLQRLASAIQLEVNRN